MTNEIEVTKAADQKYCSACAKVIHMSAETCPFCGAKQLLSAPTQLQQSYSPTQQTKQADQKFCTACGNILHISAELCPKCGAKQIVAGHIGVNNINDKNKVVAGLLGIFLGWIGAHKFYLGRTGWGLIYLIFFWTFIPGIVGFIEGIYYLIMDENQFQERVKLGLI
ncbi:MAG TPA: TM2 domain-containing protein [Paludibacter sp.]|nr:TM2 domain-containing protein [Paludibacter sp.]